MEYLPTNTPEFKQMMTLFNQTGKIGYRHTYAWKASKERTESTRELTIDEVNEIIEELKKLAPSKHFTHKPGDAIRKKIIGIARQMRWVKQNPKRKGEWMPDIERIDNWCIQYGKFKKPFMEHTPDELSKIVTVFETRVYPDFLASLNK